MRRYGDSAGWWWRVTADHQCRAYSYSGRESASDIPLSVPQSRSQNRKYSP
jgi:hypothetical protein